MATQGRLTWRVDPGAEFTRVTRALREIDATSPTKIRKELRKTANPAALSAKAAVRRMPTKGGRSWRGQRNRTRMRATVARGVSVQAKLGGGPTGKSSLRIVTKMPTRETAVIPRGFQTQFHHPYFGDNQRLWQVHEFDWFIGPIAAHGPDLQRRIEQVLRDAAQQVARAGRR